ncbi:MAG: GldG family protein [Vicinamibacterales bacterium]
MNRIFNIISWLGIALVLAAVGIRGAIGVGYMNVAQGQFAVYLAYAGLACIVIYIVSQWREILEFFGTRSGRYGTLAASSTLIMLGILVAVNYIGKKQNKRWDLTAGGQYSLSDQSRNVVAKLNQPLQVQIYDKEQEFQRYRDRLKEYEYNSKQIATEYIDPDKKPAAAQAAKIQQYGTIVFNYAGRSERTTGNTEQDITNTIIKVVSGQVKKLYFTQGHGEHDLNSGDRDGYQAINTALMNENYGVEKLALAQSPKVPDDATAVVVAGPKTDFFKPEVDALRTYLENNGKLLLMLDPPDGTSAPLTNLIALAKEWGVEVQDTLVVDVSGIGRQLGAGPEMPIAANYPSHPITDRFRVASAYPLARGLTIVSGGVNGRTASPVVESSPQGWAEADLKSLQEGKEISLDEAKGDKPGPITLAAAVNVAKPDAAPPTPGQPDTPKPETRVVVFGDSDFASNVVFGFSGNKDLFMNTVGWLSQQENLISIRPKEAADRRLKSLTATEQIVLTYASWLLMPVVVFGVGIVSWMRRR